MMMHMEVEQQHQLVYEPQSIATPAKTHNKKNNKASEEEDEDKDVSMLDLATAPPSNSAANATADSATAAGGRHRKRRSFFTYTKQQSPVPSKAAKRKSTAGGGLLNGAAERPRACLTEILWEDVQKAKELLRIRQKPPATAAAAESSALPPQCQPPLQHHPVIARIKHTVATNKPAQSLRHHHHHHRGGAFAEPIAISEEEVENQPRSTASLPGRRSHKHRRASSDLAESATTVDAASMAPDSMLVAHEVSVQSADTQHLQQQQQQQQQQQHVLEHQRRVARFWEVKRLLGELKVRKTEKLRQLAALEAKEKSLSGDFGSSTIAKIACGSLSSSTGNQTCCDSSGHHNGASLSLARSSNTASASASAATASGEGQLCFPTQYLLAVENDGAQSEVLQLQEEAAVQRALVEANARLLRECQTDRSARQLKRKRAQEFQRSQEKLRNLNLRIAEIRARDSALSYAASSLSQSSSSCMATPTASSITGHSGDRTTDSLRELLRVQQQGPAGSSSHIAVPPAASANTGGQQAQWSSQSLPALTASQQLQHQHHRLLKSCRYHTHGCTASTAAASSVSTSAAAAAAARTPGSSSTTVSHAGSVDSGFQDLTVLSSSGCCAGSSTSSLELLPGAAFNGSVSGRWLSHQLSAESLHFRPIDQEEEEEEGGAAQVDRGFALPQTQLQQALKEEAEEEDEDGEDEASGVF